MKNYSSMGLVPRSMRNDGKTKIYFLSHLETSTTYCEKQGFRRIECAPGETVGLPHQYYRVYSYDDAPIEVYSGFSNMWTAQAVRRYNERGNISLPLPASLKVAGKV